MQIPVELTFEGMEPSPEVARRVQTEASHLDRFHRRVQSIRVVLSKPPRHAGRGAEFDIHIHMTIQNTPTLTVEHAPEQPGPRDDPLKPVAEAFAAAEIQLKRTLHQVYLKTRWLRDVPPYGRVTKLFPEAGYGLILTADGDEIYFDRNSVLKPGFDWLSIGVEVRFSVRMSLDGPYASSVLAVGEHMMH